MVYRIGLLGASRIAPPAVIVPARTNDDFEVTVVGARDRAKAEAYAAEHSVPQVCDGYEALVTHPDVDVVYNALPPSGHLPWTVAALKAGKAVLCEKPFCMDAGEARDMVRAAEESGQLLMEAAHYRYHSVMQHAVEQMRAGAFGRIVSVEAEFNVPIRKNADELRWRRDLGGGGLMDLGFYPIHCLRSLTGLEPTVVSAEGVFEDGVDSKMAAQLKFGDADGRIHCTMTAEGFTATARVQGERGGLEIVNFVAPQMGCRYTTTVDGQATRHDVHGLSSYAEQLAWLGQALRGEKPVLTGGADSIANMAAIDAIYAAAGRPAWP
jgi:predicted dehydrogenase